PTAPPVPSSDPEAAPRAVPSVEPATPAVPETTPPPAPELSVIEGAAFAELPITAIHPNAKQPRQVFDEDALAELTHSIREFGVLQPVVVRPDGDGYELVMGERRLRAAQAAGLTRS